MTAITAAQATRPSRSSSSEPKGLEHRPELAAVFRGAQSLKVGSRGPAVRTMQAALVRLAKELKLPHLGLPKYGVDGIFGPETLAAVRGFQREARLVVDGICGPKTILGLSLAVKKLNGGEIDGGSGPGGAQGSGKVEYPEYGQLFKDGVLTTTMGVGFDETGADLPQRKAMLDGLRDRGFKKLDVQGLGASGLQKLGLGSAQIDPHGTYYLKETERNGRPVKVLVRWVDRYTQNPADKFGKGFANDDLVLYAGHARAGSGPDFDTRASHRGNFVLGESYDANTRGYLKGHGNDLDRTRMTKNYQMMFFNGCSTLNYFDDLRSRADGKSRKNLDVIGSTDVIYWTEMSKSVFTVLDGVMAGESANAMKAKLKRVNRNVRYTSDGFSGNRA